MRPGRGSGKKSDKTRMILGQAIYALPISIVVLGGSSEATSSPGAPGQPPRPIAPLSGSVVNQRPTLSWTPATGSEKVEVEVCADRDCTRIVKGVLSPEGSTSLTVDLSPGRYFWRVQARSGSPHQTPILTWQLTARHGRPAEAQNLSPLDLDMNGDGFADLAVPLTPTQGGIARVAIFYGSATGFQVAPTTLVAPAEGYGFGSSVVAVGDVNGDGFGDLAVTAPSGGERSLECGGNTVMGDVTPSNRKVPDATGRVYVYLGSPTGPKGLPDVSLAGEELGARLGEWISGGGDINGDGYADMLLESAGGPPPDLSCSPQNGSPSSLVSHKVSLYFGDGQPFQAPRTVRLTMWQAPPNPPTAADCSSERAAIIGDMNGDGYADVCAICEKERVAIAKVQFGSAVGVESRSEVRLRGAPGYRASVIALRSDIDGDGRADLLLVPQFTYAPITWYRSFSGRKPSYLEPIQKLAVPRDIGRRAVVHDFNGDGFSDLVLAVGGFSKRAFLYMGSAQGLQAKPRVIAAPAGALRFATWNSAGDFNGDGFGDLALAAFAPDIGDRVYLYFGGPSGLPETPTAMLIPPSANNP
jgi:FG-GAP repeat/FG-GAP-like repeat